MCVFELACADKSSLSVPMNGVSRLRLETFNLCLVGQFGLLTSPSLTPRLCVFGSVNAFHSIFAITMSQYRYNINVVSVSRLRLEFIACNGHSGLTFEFE